MNLRTGFGYDVHRLKKGRKLVLGGVAIPYKLGLLGHSDADVILHSISDAILGALGLEDIGVQFPNTSPKYKDISSLILLKKVCQMAEKMKAKIVNIDSVVLAQNPKITPYRKQMISNISKVTGIKNVNIKATTNEGIGLIGKNEGIACMSTVLITR